MQRDFSRSRLVDVAILILALDFVALFWVWGALNGPQDDFWLYWLGGAALQAGLNPYEPTNLALLAGQLVVPAPAAVGSGQAADLSGPVLAAAIMIPLLALSPGPASIVFALVNIVGILVALALIARVSGSTRTWRWAALASIAWPISLSLSLGQPNGIIAVCIALSGWAVMRRPRLEALLAGLPIGLAAWLKILPLVLLGYFLVTRRWAALAWGMVGGLLAVVVPALLYGPQHWIEFIRYTTLLSARYGVGENLSITGIVVRLQQGGLESLLDDRTARPLTPSAVALLVLGLLLIVWALWSARTLPVPAAYTLVLAVTFLAAPISWPHYLGWLLPFAFAWSALQTHGWARWGIFAGTLLLVVSPPPLVVWSPFWVLVRWQSIALVVLIVSIVIGRRGGRQEDAPRSDEARFELR